MVLTKVLRFFGKKSKKKTKAKKKSLRKSRKTKIVKRKKVIKKASSRKFHKEREKLIGVVVHRFSKINVAVLKLKGALTLGDAVHFKGHTTDFNQSIKSMQIDHNPIKKASTGAEIGLLVKKKVRIHDKVFKVKK